MKYRVIGWTDDYNPDFEFMEDAGRSWAVHMAVVDDIKKHGYFFSGQEHQDRNCCTPVLNNGKKCDFSRRGFAYIMSDAHYGHEENYFPFFVDLLVPEKKVFPTDIIYDENFDIETFVPETDLNETFIHEIDETNFELASDKNYIKIEDIDKFRYIDKGDTLVLNYGGKTKELLVDDVERLHTKESKTLTIKFKKEN